jgi:hypothetical protein
MPFQHLDSPRTVALASASRATPFPDDAAAEPGRSAPPPRPPFALAAPGGGDAAAPWAALLRLGDSAPPAPPPLLPPGDGRSARSALRERPPSPERRRRQDCRAPRRGPPRPLADAPANPAEPARPVALAGRVPAAAGPSGVHTSSSSDVGGCTVGDANALGGGAPAEGGAAPDTRSCVNISHSALHDTFTPHP